MRDWSEHRASLGLGLGQASPLFCTLSRDAGGPGRPLNPATIRGSLKGYAKRAGISKRVHPHGLRHTAAYDYALAGIPVPLIQRQLGHESLDMTSHYIDHLTPHDVLTAIRGLQWPGGSSPPPTTRAATSQGIFAPASAPTLDREAAILESESRRAALRGCGSASRARGCPRPGSSGSSRTSPAR